VPKQFVNELKKNDVVDSYFGVVEKEPIRSYANGFLFAVKVSDKTGNVLVKYWGGSDQDVVKQVFSSFEAQKDVINVKGKVGEYRGQLEIAVNPPDGEITKTDSFSEEDLVLTTTRNIEQMKTEFLEIIERINDLDIKRLLKSFFDDEEFLKQFAISSAAQTRHHNYLGGLLEHVLSLIDISKNIVKLHPKLNLDLLIAGCILHDIGKIKEYEMGLSIGYSTEGKLFGHISIGQQMVAEKIKSLEPFPEIIAQKIIHMILSHHGQFEWGSPVKPAFPEAIALHYIDQVDAKIKGVFQVLEKIDAEEDWVNFTRDYGNLFLK